MAFCQKTYTLTALASGTETIPRYTDMNMYSIDVISSTGAFSLVFQGSPDGTKWKDLHQTGALTADTFDARLVPVYPTYLYTRCTVTDESGSANSVVVYITPFWDSENLFSSQIRVLHTETILTVAASQNIFQITGAVEIQYIYGIVTTALDADITGAVLELWDGTTATDITKTVGAPDISSLPVNSFLGKTQAATSILTVGDSTNGGVVESVGNILSLFTAWEKTGSVSTYIRFTRGGTGSSGVIHWHIDWRPLSEDGSVIVA